jgi:serine kinase of HPr protein (carbohydrate metabolism regulator)
MTPNAPTIHASAVLIGAKAVLIRGPSGAGKSSLAFDLIQAAKSGGLLGSLPFARLVADDRTVVEAHSGRLLVRPAPALAGLIEIHGLGIRTLPHEELAVVGLIVDLAASDAARLPAQEAESTEISGIRLPRLAIAAGAPALPMVLGWLGTRPGTASSGD